MKVNTRDENRQSKSMIQWTPLTYHIFYVVIKVRAIRLAGNFEPPSEVQMVVLISFHFNPIIYFFIADLPIVSLQFGTILKPDSIKEGDDIYFECIVEARPAVSQIEWYLNVSIQKLVHVLFNKVKNITPKGSEIQDRPKKFEIVQILNS